MWAQTKSILRSGDSSSVLSIMNRFIHQASGDTVTGEPILRPSTAAAFSSARHAARASPVLMLACESWSGSLKPRMRVGMFSAAKSVFSVSSRAAESEYSIGTNGAVTFPAP
jgi:hypothetical protein